MLDGWQQVSDDDAGCKIQGLLKYFAGDVSTKKNSRGSVLATVRYCSLFLLLLQDPVDKKMLAASLADGSCYDDDLRHDFILIPE